ncbi:hypothetical protein ACOSQ2_027172 [Xanthoceras sorbifolium]
MEHCNIRYKINCHLDAYLLLLRKRQILYPTTYSKKINVMCPYFYTQLKNIYKEKYQQDDMNPNAPRGFPFKNIDFGQGLVESYQSRGNSRYNLGWDAYALRIIEFLLAEHKIMYTDMEIGRHKLQMALDVYINAVEDSEDN